VKSLLVPIDGSDNSMRAFDYAIAQSASDSLTIHLLNVEPPLDNYGMVRAYLSEQQHLKAMKARANAVLRKAIGRIRPAQVQCKTHVAIGEVATTIVATAQRLECEAIVMGTRGMGSFGNLVLGSVASKVIHLAEVPVTLVK
jgi:nucleotide-binding universal stress UspA family protein